jgi:hypothetical protein
MDKSTALIKTKFYGYNLPWLRLTTWCWEMSSICYRKALKKYELKGNPKTYIWCLRNIIGALNPGYIFYKRQPANRRRDRSAVPRGPEGHMNSFFFSHQLEDSNYPWPGSDFEGHI